MDRLYIGFSRSTKWFPIGSWLIMLVDKAPYSHTYLKFYSTSLNRMLVYQAVGSGTQFCNNALFLNHNNVIEEYEIEITEESRLDLLKKCVDVVGTKYSLRDMAGIAIVKFLNLFGIKIRNPIGDGNAGYVCSGLVGMLLQSINEIPDLDTDLTTPKDINKAIKQIPNIKRVE